MGGILKGILLAGGSGTRLYPMTLVTSKQLLPVYDKPMVYYPLTTLMLAGIREILLISTPHDLPLFQALLGDGSQWGLSLSTRLSPSPKVWPRHLLLVPSLSKAVRRRLFSGDNIFFGHGLPVLLANACSRSVGATVFAYHVADPARYGVVAFDSKGQATSIEEKPKQPKSNFAVTGLYFYDEQVVDIAANIQPSARGELEITDLNRIYLERSELAVERMGRGFTWLDTGTPESLLEAAEFVATLEKRQGFRIACPEEVAFNEGFIDRDQLARLGDALGKSDYARYLTTSGVPTGPVTTAHIPQFQQVVFVRRQTLQ